MASTNIFTRFKALNASSPQMRAQVTVVDSVNNRVKVTYTGFNEWVTGVAAVNDFVLVQDSAVVTVLPNLPYLDLEI